MAIAILLFRGIIPDNLMLPPYWWGRRGLWECDSAIIQLRVTPSLLMFFCTIQLASASGATTTDPSTH